MECSCDDVENADGMDESCDGSGDNPAATDSAAIGGGKKVVICAADVNLELSNQHPVLLSTLGSNPTCCCWPLAALIPLPVEATLLQVCIRWVNEVGFIHTQPAFRLAEIRQVCNNEGISLLTALSLRRHWVRQNNKYRSEKFLRLGTFAQKKAAASIFENIVASHLDRLSITYVTEQGQKGGSGHKEPGVATPDFLLTPPVAINGRLVHWIEVKHFYGAGTIPRDETSACGSIPSKSRKYVAQFGSGAFVFAYGCCDALYSAMAEGVMVLDERVLLAFLGPLHAQLRTWCANKQGEILP